jgi:hypothetical protein
MDAPPALSRFELAAAELRALGIVIARLPGEYRVNFRNRLLRVACLRVEVKAFQLAHDRFGEAAERPLLEFVGDSAHREITGQPHGRRCPMQFPLIQHRYKLSISSRTAASGSLSTNHRSSVSNMDRNADFLIVLMSIPFSAFSAAAARQTMSIKRSAP